jgi:hypothetical protein
MIIQGVTLSGVTVTDSETSVTYMTNGNQVLTNNYGSGAATRLGGQYADGNVFNGAVIDGLVPIGSRVIVKWERVSVERDMGIVTSKQQVGSNAYVYVTNPGGYNVPVQTGSQLSDSRATYFRVVIPRSH